MYCLRLFGSIFLLSTVFFPVLSGAEGDNDLYSSDTLVGAKRNAGSTLALGRRSRISETKALEVPSDSSSGKRRWFGKRSGRKRARLTGLTKSRGGLGRVESNHLDPGRSDAGNMDTASTNLHGDFDSSSTLKASALASQEDGSSVATVKGGTVAEKEDVFYPELTAKQPPTSRNAFAAIVYCGTPRDYEFFMATRVMLRTVKLTGTSADLVVLASADVPSSWEHSLVQDGVRVMRSSNLANPYNLSASYNPRFRFALNKLLAWSLVEYARVVLLDADNLVLRNADELFLCGDFCAVFLNPCIFHTGLVVLKPSKRTLRKMVRRLTTLPSFDAADQGFLVSYFPDLLGSPLFVPPPNASAAVAARTLRPLRGLFRLPMGYQMDAIYYNLKFKWYVPCSENKVITFPGISALKPWYWWTWPVLALGLEWHRWRLTTIGYAPEFAASLFVACLWLGLLLWDHIWAALFLRSAASRSGSPRADKAPAGTGAGASLPAGVPGVGSRLGWGLSKVLVGAGGVLRAALTLGSIPLTGFLSYLLVPATVHPLVGWPLFFLGTFALLRVVRGILGTPLTIYWLPAYVAAAMVVIALPIYSALAFKLAIFHVLAFGGGVTSVMVYQSLVSAEPSRTVKVDHRDA